ncbi:transformation system realted protein, putative [Babesia ovis]|uniref:Transformation system realted protein, putative n=1 Tax=Babesia ovis TaxID=5869 RepID=A0A9W5T8B4_BABOV|nr:transformation system realted protein, putative [Babesia ovis]
MEGVNPKRTPEEVLFKWEDGTEAKRHQGSALSAGVSAVSSFLVEPLSARAASAFNNIVSSRVVPSDRIDEKNIHVEAQRLRDTVANIQLSHNRDWLASNTNVAALGKLDVLDRISCLLLNRESAMRYDSLRYAQRESVSEFEFNRLLYEARLSRLNSAIIPEYCSQPVYIRNSTLVSKFKAKCGCPLHVYVEWNMRHTRSNERGMEGYYPGNISLGAIHRTSQTLAHDQSVVSSALAGREAALRATSNVPNGSTNISSTIGNLATSSMVNRLTGGGSQVFTDALSSFPGAATTDIDDWKLKETHFRRDSQVKGPVPTSKNAVGETSTNALEHMEAICPMHSAVALPDLLCDRGGVMHVIPELGLICRYDRSTINGEGVHVLSMHKLRSGHKVSHFRLPSKLQTMKAIYLRDFELERYSSAFDMHENINGHNRKVGNTYICSLYSGPALFIATSTEFIIAVVHEASGDIRLGILYREINAGQEIREIVCHQASGRVFILAANSQLYEFQYQLGSVDTRDNSIFGKIISTAAKGCKFILNALSSDRVYRLYGTVASGYSVDPTLGERDASTGEMLNWWESSGNCLHDFMSPCPAIGAAFWPPVEWRALHLSLQQSSFADTLGGDSCTCVRHSSCIKRECRSCLKLLTPWNKSFFGVLSVGESSISIDEDRWLLSLLSNDSGDLSVFKIPDECTFERFVKGVVDFDSVFPYNLTFFCLRQGDMINQLTKAGYTRYIGSTLGFRCVNVLSAPMRGPEGVDIILVDQHGTRIFVGFVTDSARKTSLVVKGFKIPQSGTNRCAPSTNMSLQYVGRFFRDRFAGIEFGAFPTKRRYYHAKDLFISTEFYPKNGNLLVAKVTLFAPESASLCQSSGDSPQSVSEELWSHTQKISGSNSGTSNANTTSPLRSIEWFDEFCILMTPGEDILSVYAEHVPSTMGNIRCTDWELVIVTSQKIYCFRRSGLYHVIEALLQHPTSTLKYINPPLQWRDQQTPLSARGRDTLSEHNENSVFLDIFADGADRNERSGEDMNRELVACGLYYLCWLYTPEEVFKVCWQLFMKQCDPLMQSWLIQGNENNLLLSSMGIASRLFGWTAPGAYAIDDMGNPTTPIVSPWCKFVVFNEPRMQRFNRVSTGVTSAAIDGMISLLSSMLETVWLERSFVCSPLFTSGSYVPTPKGPVPFTPSDQLPRKNEFVVGPKFASNMVLCLSRPIEEVKSLLVQMRKLYLVLREVTLNYESLQNTTITSLAESVARLMPKLQRDIFSVDDTPSLVSNTDDLSTGPHDTMGVLNKLRERHEHDIKTLRELVTLLEISQEYIACSILLHRNCVLGDVQHEFERLFTKLQMLPSQSRGRVSLSDLQCRRMIHRDDPLVSVFNVQHCDALDTTPYAFTMSREFFYVISRSNLLNLCSNQEFFRTFRVAVWLAGGEVSNLQDYFYGHLFKPDELRMKHWSSMVKSLERQLATADSDASVAHYARLLMRFLGEKQASE